MPFIRFFNDFCGYNKKWIPCSPQEYFVTTFGRPGNDKIGPFALEKKEKEIGYFKNTRV